MSKDVGMGDRRATPPIERRKTEPKEVRVNSLTSLRNQIVVSDNEAAPGIELLPHRDAAEQGVLRVVRASRST